MNAATVTKSIHVTSGHLTAREKSVIVHMLNNGMTNAKTARITFALESVSSGAYRVTTSRVESDDWGRKTTRSSRATFEAKP